MCTLVCLAADASIPIRPWDTLRPAFHIRAVDDVEHARIQRYTARRHIYYVGTREKCDCPFSYGTWVRRLLWPAGYPRGGDRESTGACTCDSGRFAGGRAHRAGG